ncbi:hypothetical protein FF2_004084 [Malus domestica]
MPPRREPRQPAESSFPGIAQLGEVIVSAIQTTFRTPQMTPLETVHNMKLTYFMGNEGPEGAEKWLNHMEKTFQVMKSQGNLLPDRWVETTTLFLGEQPASWWRHESYEMTPEEIMDWGVFKERFQKRFIPPAYIDLKKQEFTHLRQGKMSANEYYRMFTDLSIYDPEIAANPVETLRRFSLGTKKKWHSIATLTYCASYQEFYEILLRIETSQNMPSESENEEGNNRG